MSQGFSIRWIVRLIPAILVLQAIAGGPNYVTGPGSARPGEPYRWAGNSLSYKTDLGGLGNQTNAQADAMVSAAFDVWQNISSADVHIQSEGELSLDVASSNITMFMQAIGSCSDTSQPMNSIVYDIDGSIINALLGAGQSNSVLGFAGIICTNDTAGIYTRGWSVMNGRFIDGQASSPSHLTVSLEEFQGVFIHEFGHLLGLGHSQLNVNCISSMGCSTTDLAGVPTMFPILLDLTQATPKTDDVAAISSLYPASTFYASTGRIQGQVLFGDGLTPAQGYNVIARQVENPRSIAVSSVSGFLFTAGAGNSLVPDGMDSSFFFGSHDASLIGYYDIPGLPPGAYTVETEAINNSAPIPFVYASGVGPIGQYLGFQYKMPGICKPQYLSDTTLCSARTTLTVGAGQVLSEDTNIILVGSPPRFDAWEDEQ